MALDIIPASSKEMRLKIIKNIGISFVKLGQFHEAISSFETIMKGLKISITTINKFSQFNF